LDLVNQNIQRVRQSAVYEDLMGFRFDPLPRTSLESIEDLRKVFGITYLSPVDMRRTEFEDSSFDFISSSKVLEHVPEYEIPAILRECRRLLNLRGVLSLDIDMGDHFAQGDSSITSFNFLRHKDLLWNCLQSGLNFQNRLRLPDYEAMLDKAGFEALHLDLTYGTDQEIQTLKQWTLAGRFAGKYTIRELGAKVANIALRGRYS